MYDAKELREYLESLPCPFCTVGFSDEQLDDIAMDLNVEMRDVLEWERNGDCNHDTVEEYELETLERLCIAAGMKYYEDLENSEKYNLNE